YEYQKCLFCKYFFLHISSEQMAAESQGTFESIMHDLKPQRKKTPRTFHNCEFDSNLTDFEFLNNYLSLGVYANNMSDAKIKLVLLRMIYDFPNGITETLEEWYGEQYSQFLEDEGG